MAMVVSSPYPLLSDVVEDTSYKKMIRCRLIYPQPETEFRKTLTVITLSIQYLIPLLISGITYSKICCIIWHRPSIGAVTPNQKTRLQTAKWKTIKMLMVVFIVFSFCWLPLNMYHVYQDIRGVVGPMKHNSTIFLMCHWFAMSSVCYNPFIYCWLNDSFRNMIAQNFRWFLSTPRKTRNFFVSHPLRKHRKDKLLECGNTKDLTQISSSSKKCKDSLLYVCKTEEWALTSSQSSMLRKQKSEAHKTLEKSVIKNSEKIHHSVKVEVKESAVIGYT
ncbi:putative G-protein coupled receptor 83, partial [Stegodyphus mimosarum]